MKIKQLGISEWWFIIFLVSGQITQVIAYWWMPNNIWNLVSGVFGIVAVVLCAKGNILTYIFGFAQIATYTYLCYLERLYAGIAMNAFYFLCQIYGSYNWYRRIKGNYSISVPTLSLSGQKLLFLILGLVVFSIITGIYLDRFTDDTQPYLDAFTTVPALVAEVLMILAIREHWYFWFFIDILFVIMWYRANNYCMVMQYSFWCMNCLYGYWQWTRSLKSRPSKV